MRPIVALFILLLCAPCYAGDRETDADYLREKYPSLMDESFVVQTSDEDATDSLNRVAGKIDRGFAAEDYTYKSEHHGRTGPFSYEDQYDRSTGY